MAMVRIIAKLMQLIFGNEKMILECPWRQACTMIRRQGRSLCWKSRRSTSLYNEVKKRFGERCSPLDGLRYDFDQAVVCKN